MTSRNVGLGDAYYLGGRVLDVHLTDEGGIEARVSGDRIYEVFLNVGGGKIHVSCTCPWFQRQFEACKHIWAAIRAASADLLLPEREIHVLSTYDERSWERPRLAAVARIREVPPPWKRFLDALGPATPVD